MTRLLLNLLLLAVAADAAAMEPQIIRPIFIKPEEAPPPQGPGHVAPVLESDSCAKPRYPEKSDLGEGAVTLHFLIAADGHVADSRIVTSSGYQQLDEIARDAIALCRFEPGKTPEGEPEQAWALIRYIWTH